MYLIQTNAVKTVGKMEVVDFSSNGYVTLLEVFIYF